MDQQANQVQQDTHDPETPLQKKGYIERINELLKQYPTSTTLTLIVLFLLLTALAITINSAQKRQETQSTAHYVCSGSGVGADCPPTITVAAYIMETPGITTPTIELTPTIEPTLTPAATLIPTEQPTITPTVLLTLPPHVSPDISQPMPTLQPFLRLQ